MFGKIKIKQEKQRRYLTLGIVLKIRSKSLGQLRIFQICKERGGCKTNMTEWWRVNTEVTKLF